MKVVNMFETTDGKVFASKDAAKRHEVEYEAMSKLRSLLSASINSELVRRGNIDNVLRQLLLENTEVRNVLQSFTRKMPKAEAIAA